MYMYEYYRYALTYQSAKDMSKNMMTDIEQQGHNVCFLYAKILPVVNTKHTNVFKHKWLNTKQ